MSRVSSWSSIHIEHLEALYARQGAQFLSQNEIAREMNKRFDDLHLTTNAVVGKAHRLHLHTKYPRGSVTAHHIGNHSRGRKIGPGRQVPARKFNDFLVEDRMASNLPTKPVRIAPHTVDLSKHCLMEQAMEQGTCLWPVNDGLVCGCDRDKSGPLVRPSSYCVSHRKKGTQEARKREHSDAYVSSRMKLSSMRYR
jgi:hypothetical protein